MSEEREHRRFSASQADRNALCLGSSNLLARVPKAPPSKYAIEGTHAHAVLEAALRNGVRDAREAHRDYSYLFDVDLDDGTNEFYLAIDTALNYIYDLWDQYPDAQVYIEAEIPVPVTNAPGEADGYADFVMYVPALRKVYVIDYKHGAGVAKEADCRQLKQYGAGVVFGLLADVPDVEDATLVIVQPRAFHKLGPIREYDTTALELWNYLEELDGVIAEAQKPNAPLTPGHVQCQFCDGVPFCPAREASALQVASNAFTQIRDLQAHGLPETHLMDLQRLAYIRANAWRLRKWLDEVEDRCYQLAREGHHIPGAKLVEAAPKRKYYGEERDVAHKLAALLGEPQLTDGVWQLYNLLDAYPALGTMFRPHLVPLTTAEKLVVEAYKKRAGRGHKKKAAEDGRQSFAFLTLKETSGTLTLVDEDDERPAVNSVQNTFAQINTAALPAPK